MAPVQYLGLGLHSRAMCGRPSRGDHREEEEGEPAWCLCRIQQTKGFSVPKTTAVQPSWRLCTQRTPAPCAAQKR